MMEINFMCLSLYYTNLSGDCIYTALIAPYFGNSNLLIFFYLCKTSKYEVQTGTWSNRGYSGTWLKHKFKAVSEALIVY